MSKKLICLALVLYLGCLIVGCQLRDKESPTRLTYNLPTKLTIDVGQALPGTHIVYQELSDRGAHLLIDGKVAVKRKGDSFKWEGIPSDGVEVDLDLRVAWYNEDQVHLVGMAKIVIEGVAPVASTISTDSPISYAGPAVYNLAKGAIIPGSTLSYQGEQDDGAELGGTTEYPYRQVGDSVYWEGRLRQNVSIRLELRVLQYDDRGLRLGGIVSLWVG